jgi:hypothetical protein
MENNRAGRQNSQNEQRQIDAEMIWSGEQLRQAAEDERQTGEERRQQAEADRVTGELERESAELFRATTEATRVEAEAARKIAEDARQVAECHFAGDNRPGSRGQWGPPVRGRKGARQSRPIGSHLFAPEWGPPIRGRRGPLGPL